MKTTMQKHQEEQFPLPDMCDAQSLIFLLIVSQLLVMVLIMFKQGVSFDWVYFCFLTVYVQWQAMLSALLLCRLRIHFSKTHMPTGKGFGISYLALLLLSIVYSVIVILFAILFSLRKDSSYLKEAQMTFCSRNFNGIFEIISNFDQEYESTDGALSSILSTVAFPLLLFPSIDLIQRAPLFAGVSPGNGLRVNAYSSIEELSE